MALLGSATALDAYRVSLTGIEPLSAVEERVLAQRWRNGDQDAGRRLVEASLPFVITVATEYRRWGIPLEDLIQQGNLGLLKGALRFEPSRECRLITYAVYWIRAEIRDYVVRGYRVVRIGGSKGERRALRAYRRTREEDPEKLAAVSGIDAKRVEQLMPLFKQRDVSLDAAEPGETPGVERLRDTKPSPEETVLQKVDNEITHSRIQEALGLLTARERWVLERRVLADTGTTLEALGQKLGISKERVRQIEARALEKLRESLSDLAAA
ncbi:MAG: sigma-70 family RNA polymerase sigma factor [Polyangiales bacterium]